MKKPTLPKLKTSPVTDLEKDNEKIGKCMHPDENVYPISADSAHKEWLECDFNPENSKKHMLFEGTGRNAGAALHCTKCGALICRGCYSGTPIDSPTSDGENNNNPNNSNSHSHSNSSGSNNKPNSSNNNTSSGNNNGSENNSSSSNNNNSSSNNNSVTDNNCKTVSFIEYSFITLSYFANIISEIINFML